jgi:hypothetical protein
MTVMGGMAARLPIFAKGVVVPVHLYLYWIRHTKTVTLGAGDLQIAARDQQACTQGVKHQQVIKNVWAGTPSRRLLIQCCPVTDAPTEGCMLVQSWL